MRRLLDRNSLILLLCGLSALYWELVLIRWLGASIRIVAYYSNFVLIAAFFGLGTGALLARFGYPLRRLLCPALALGVLLGVVLGSFEQSNPASADEHIWLGGPSGLIPDAAAEPGEVAVLPLLGVLLAVYLATAGIFAIFGQWIGHLFRRLEPLWAYSVEVAGSLLGIALFALLSWLEATPLVWFAVGFAPLLAILEVRRRDLAVALVCTAATLAIAGPFGAHSHWSPYYRIQTEPITRVIERTDQGAWQPVSFDPPVGHTLTVNNDYHQMLLDLREREADHAFLNAWREFYERPYQDLARLPPGPILVVGAGTGNDVCAALRRTERRIVAVEIDPLIVRLGRELHPERPYDDPRVTLVVNDARAYFQETRERFAMVVFGYLDSHTLLSSFSSLRLDNFVYTREALEQVRRILLPGGQVHLSFAIDLEWMHRRFIALLDECFDAPTVSSGNTTAYTYGVVYSNRRARAGDPVRESAGRRSAARELPTDSWPFLYLPERRIPGHYLLFLGVVLALGLASMGLLPSGQRRLRLPYFLLGAGFFLIETGNVVSLALLFGSTWTVNALVFSGILLLVLLGNLSCHLVRRPRIRLYFALLGASLIAAWIVPTAALLEVSHPPLRLALAVVVFLGPVYFASLIFATLIQRERHLYQAYGSNILGAVVGGAAEYLSLLVGFKTLLLLPLGIYLGTYLLLRRGPGTPPQSR